jgi:tetratricopeptide (TPR) repeat protein
MRPLVARARSLAWGPLESFITLFEFPFLMVGWTSPIEWLYLRWAKDGPNRVVWLSRIAFACEKGRRFDKALAYYNEAISISPCDPILHWELGCVLDQLGARASAGISFQRCLEYGGDLGEEFRRELSLKIAALESSA